MGWVQCCMRDFDRSTARAEFSNSSSSTSYWDIRGQNGTAQGFTICFTVFDVLPSKFGSPA